MKKILSFFITIFIIFISVNVNALEVKYEGANKGIILDGDSLFSNLDLAYPGDYVIDEVNINNTTGVPLSVYMKVNSESSDLADVLLLNITLIENENERVIYNGDFNATSINDYTFLGNYKSGFNGTLRFTLSIPASLNNDFANEELNSVITFKVEDFGYNDKVIPINGVDTTGDGIITGDDDSDGDGIIDSEDDSDGDGIVDSEDADTRGGRDTNGDGKINGDDDWDGDGIPDGIDDSDGDGIVDNEDADIRGNKDKDGGIDTNGDGKITGDDDWNHNGIKDSEEDSDGDGIMDDEDLDTRGGIDTNGDGKINGDDDWDGDGIPDGIDDSDGDGIVDNEDPDIRGIKIPKKEDKKPIISPTTYDGIAKYFALLVLSIIGIALYFVNTKKNEGE